MDTLIENNALHVWLLHYGSFALFFLLALGIVALPVPEETLMITAGVLMQQGDLQIAETIVAAFLGSLCGITTSYFLGRTAGHYLILRFGKWVGMTEAHLNKAHGWFERLGKWTLFIGYFIPGVRHFTGLSAGMATLDFKSFALFAYSGALIWVATFLSIGYFFGNYWVSVIENIEMSGDLVTFLLLAIVIYVAYLIHKRAAPPE